MRLRYFLSLGAVLLAVAGPARAEAPNLPATSPFTPNGAAPAAGAGPDAVEFAGVSTSGKQTLVSLYDVGAKHGRWIPVGGKTDGIEVVSYDPKHEQVVVRVYGTLKLLNLRRGTTGGPAVVAPVVVAGAAAPPPTPAPEAAPGEKRKLTQREHDEEEARMFVSDMLEIGLQNRKAYEEAQRNTTTAAGPTTGVPPGTAYVPTLAPPAAPPETVETPPTPAAP